MKMFKYPLALFQVPIPSPRRSLFLFALLPNPSSLPSTEPGRQSHLLAAIARAWPCTCTPATLRLGDWLRRMPPRYPTAGARTAPPRRDQPFPCSPSGGAQLSRRSWQPSTRTCCRASWQRHGAAGKAGGGVALGRQRGGAREAGEVERAREAAMQAWLASTVREPSSGGCG